MFEIEVNTGEEGMMWLRGTSDGTVELCKKSMLTATKENPEPREGLVAFKYYANPVQAFERVLKMRVGSCEAKTLGELVIAITEIRKDLRLQLGMTMEPKRGSVNGIPGEKFDVIVADVKAGGKAKIKTLATKEQFGHVRKTSRLDADVSREQRGMDSSEDGSGEVHLQLDEGTDTAEDQ